MTSRESATKGLGAVGQRKSYSTAAVASTSDPQRLTEPTMNNSADAQPENHLVLTRRQLRRISPSSTIESGRMIPTIADLLFASARTFTQVVALADTSSFEPAVRVGLGFSAAALVGSFEILGAEALGAGFVASRARVSVAIPGRILAGCVEGSVGDGTTATEASRGTDTCCNVRA